MKKKILKMLAFFLALCLLTAVVLFADLMLGNPVSKALAQKNVQEYLSLHHAREGYEIESIAYNWYNTEYIVECAVPGSLDLCFQMDTDCLGNIKSTTYEYDILLHSKTAKRLNKAYMQSFDAMFKNDELIPFYTHLGLASLAFADSYDTQNAPVAFRQEDLQADEEYSLRELGATTGHLYLNVHDETVSVERLSEILLAVKKAADDMGLTFYDVDCSLNLPFDDRGYAPDSDGVAVYAFLYSDIYEEGMIDRVRIASEHAYD